MALRDPRRLRHGRHRHGQHMRQTSNSKAGARAAGARPCPWPRGLVPTLIMSGTRVPSSQRTNLPGRETWWSTRAASAGWALLLLAHAGFSRVLLPVAELAQVPAVVGVQDDQGVIFHALAL